MRVECVDGRAQALERAIVDWPGVGRVTSADSILHVTVDDVSSFVPRLFQVEAEGIRTIRIEPSTLEDAYFAMAGASLRDEAPSSLVETPPVDSLPTREESDTP